MLKYFSTSDFISQEVCQRKIWAVNFRTQIFLVVDDHKCFWNPWSVQQLVDYTHLFLIKYYEVSYF